MHHRWRPVVLLVPLVTLAASCGDEPTDGADAATTVATATDPATLETYCDRVADYLTGGYDPTSVAALFDAYDMATEKTRAMADAAPAAVRDAHELFATATERLEAGIRAAAPESTDEFFEVSEEIAAELETELGDLDAVTAQISAFTEATCGTDIDG